jgi:hypothetical protein
MVESGENVDLNDPRSPGWDGERCQVCGDGYDTVYWLPDDWWALITPKPDEPSAGLLCPECALLRITQWRLARWMKSLA